MKMTLKRLLAILLLSFSLTLNGQVPFQLDTTFQSDMDGMIEDYWYDGIKEFWVEDDQSIIIAGWFSNDDQYQYPAMVAKLAPNGSLDHSFHYQHYDFGVYATQVTKHNGMYYVGYCGRPGISRLFPDGSVDTTFRFPMEIFWLDAVQPSDIYVYPDGKVLVSGHFSLSAAGGWGLLRLNQDGSIDSTFNLSFVDKYLDHILPLKDGKFIICGAKYDMQQTRSSVWRIHPDGTLDTTFNTNSTGLACSFADTVAGTDMIVVCGLIHLPGISQTLGLVRLNNDGSLDPTFNNNNSFDTYPYRTFYDGNRILVGGGFKTINGITCNSLAVFDTLGNLDTVLSKTLPGPDSSDWFHSFGVSGIQKQGEKILCSGTFTSFNGHPTFCMVRLFDISVGIEEEFASSDFTLYPNPTREYLSLAFSSPQTGEYQLLDLSGRMLYSGILHDKAQRHSIALPKLATGVYLFRVKSKDGQEFVKKVVVR